MSTVISESIRGLVMLRSNHSCEYCKSQDKFSPVFFTIDHVIPLIEGGKNDPDNLAYACPLCNRLKAHKLTALDSATNSIVPIFNPRHDEWGDHFQWSEDYLLVLGISTIGRATVNALQLNRKKLVLYGRKMFDIGQHPQQ